MDDFDVKTCFICNTERPFWHLSLKNSECKACNTKIYWYNNKDEILQQRRGKYARFKDLDSRIKTLEDRLSFLNLATRFVNFTVMEKI